MANSKESSNKKDIETRKQEAIKRIERDSKKPSK